MPYFIGSTFQDFVSTSYQARSFTATLSGTVFVSPGARATFVKARSSFTGRSTFEPSNPT